MKHFAFTIVLLLAAGASSGQVIRVPPYRHVAQLGVCATGSPKLVAVTDGASSSDCSLGGGAFEVLCFCHGGAWEAGGVGPKGDKGDPGEVGPQGNPGAAGATGAQGPAGSVGPTGATGSPGAAGSPGTPGAAGADGIPRTVLDEGSALTQRLNLNFTGAGVSCADNSGASRTDCTIPGASGIGGSTGSIDRAVAIADGASGSLAQGSSVTIDSSGNMTLPAGKYFRSGTTNSDSLLKAVAGSGGWQFRTGDDLYFQAITSYVLVLKEYDGSQTASFTVRSIKLTTGASPGTCNSGMKGTIYFASGDGSMCSCNGSAWTPTPSTGTCN